MCRGTKSPAYNSGVNGRDELCIKEINKNISTAHVGHREEVEGRGLGEDAVLTSGSRHRSGYRGVGEMTLIGLLIALLDTRVPRDELALWFSAGRAGTAVWAGAALVPPTFSSTRDQNGAARRCNEFGRSQLCCHACRYPTNPALMGLTK